MSLLLASTGIDRVHVRTMGMNPPGEHEEVTIGLAEVMMDDFCEMVKQFVRGNLALQAGPYLIDYLNPVLAFSIGPTGGFCMSTRDFYMMARYVLTNTDIYIPLDPRPGLYQWLTEQTTGRNPNMPGDEDRDEFIKDCIEGGVHPGYNAGGFRLYIPGCA